METVKDLLNFCNAAVFYDDTDIGTTCELTVFIRQYQIVGFL